MERAFSLKRGVIDLETGEFPLTLLTNGPASDPHIIDVKTLEVADRVTMFVNHEADPRTRMGGMINPHKVGKKTVLAGASLKMDGIIDMQGDNAMADIRRDVAQGISVGDVTAMSVRWDGEGVARSSLKETHYAYSNIEGGWETPMFFAGARVLEGSIVGVPADAAALIGRSRDLNRPAHVRDFYRVLVNGDPLSRDKAMADLFVAASDIDGLEEIELDEGVKFFVPVEVARVWGQSISDDENMASMLEKLAAKKLETDAIPEEALASRVREIEEEHNALTDSEPLVPEPKSETKEESEPLRSEPTPPQTASPVEVLPTLPTLLERQKAIDEKFDRWRYETLGYVK